MKASVVYQIAQELSVGQQYALLNMLSNDLLDASTSSVCSKNSEELEIEQRLIANKILIKPNGNRGSKEVYCKDKAKNKTLRL